MEQETMSGLLEEIRTLLSRVGEREWNDSFALIQARIRNGEPYLARDVLRIFGGMGSFSDLVLYEDGNLLLDETVQLDELRKRLFVAASSEA